jgi:hypothetical protein
MSIRKLLPLAALVLAIAALTPASALAKKGGNGQTWNVKATVSGTTLINVPSEGQFTSYVTGHASPGGNYTRAAVGSLSTGHGKFVVTYAKGDQLTGEFQVTTAPGVNPQVVDIEIQGGNGRFEGACGWATETDYLTEISPEIISREGTVVGEVGYEPYCPEAP